MYYNKKATRHYRSCTKGIGPVVASALLLVVAVVAVVGFQTWFGDFSSSVFSKVEIQGGGDSLKTKIEAMIGDELYFTNGKSSNLTITNVKVGGVDCNVTSTASSGLNTLWLDTCLNSQSPGEKDVVVFTNDGIYSQKYYVKDIPSVQPTLDLRFDQMSGALSWPSLVNFTRGSVATYLDSDGLIKNAPHNLLLRSEEANDVTWSKTQLIVSSDVITAPDSTLTADKLVEDGTSNARYLRQQVNSLTPNKIYTFTIFLKKAEREYAYIDFWGASGNVYSEINLSNGEIISSGGSYSNKSYSISSFGDGWYRASISASISSDTTIYPQIYIRNESTVSIYQGDSTSGIYVWGAQLEENPTPSRYMKTTSTQNFNGPRIEYDTSGNVKGLLIEEARTNLMLWSENFSAGGWGATDLTATQLQISNNIFNNKVNKLTEGTTTGVHNKYRFNTISASTDYTFSVFAKAAERTKLLIWVDQFSGGTPYNYASFDLSTGSLITIANTNASIEDFGNGWYRVSIVGNTGASTTGNAGVQVLDASGASSYTGDGTSGLYVQGIQLEQGRFPTSYIPTQGSSVTRNAEIAKITNLSWLTQGKGTILGSAYFSSPTLSGILNRYIVSFDTGSWQNMMNLLWWEFGNQGASFILNNSVSQAQLSNGGISVGDYKQMSLAFKNNDFAFSNTGGIVQTDSAGVVPSITQVNLGRRGDGAEVLGGHIKRLTYWPERLSNDKLQLITK